MLIKGAEIFTASGFTEADLRIMGNKIAAVGIDAANPCFREEHGEEIFDYSGYRIIPGIIDIHTHGRIGIDFTTASEEEIHKLLGDYLHAGVTGVLATVMTNDRNVLRSAFEKIGKIIDEQHARLEGSVPDDGRKEASVLGINFEGVWLSPAKKGAHLEEYLELPTVERYEEYYRASRENILLATIAPELEGACELISLKKDRTHFSLGHSAATYKEAVKAIEAGADHATHLFNAMPALGHREPGLVGASLDEKLYTEVICDGYHVHPAVIRMVFDSNPGRTVLISDSIAPAGLKDGVYVSGAQKVTASGGKILTDDGTIAGSGISLFEGLRRCVKDFGIDENEAIRAATLYPARSVGKDSVNGSIKTGNHADLIVIDKDYRIKDIFINGTRV